MDFTGKLIVERSAPDSGRSQVPEQSYICHCFVRNDKLAGICISDSEYPARVAQSLLSQRKILKVLLERKFPYQKLPTNKTRSQAQFKQLEAELARYQDPKKADTLSKVQGDVNDTKAIMTQTMENLLDRGEKLDDLVARSDALSAQSKAFYETAKRTRRCCNTL
uniref:V-SNARE coiled-coil homology domain-containing protein n=1 Tax=Macrostomum lignano TaxID=282301 RepID=A0A1I8GUR5_9PLAT